jgi:hypothetical protein
LPTQRGDQLERPATHRGVGIGQPAGEIVGRDGLEPLQRTERGAANARVGVVHERPSGGFVALVAGDRRPPTTTLCVG